MYHPFSASETIKTSWTVLKGNFAILAIYSVVSLVVLAFIDFLNSFVLLNSSVVSWLVVFFLQMIIQSYLALTFYKLILTLMDRQYYEFEFKEIWPSFKMAFRFIIIGIAYAILAAIFLFINLLLKDYPYTLEIVKVLERVLVGYLLVRSIFCVCFIVDEDSHAYEALLQSFIITKDYFFKILGLILVVLAVIAFMLVFILSAIALYEPDDDSFIFRLAFYVWFVLAFPAVQVIIMVTYRKLVYAHQDIDDDYSETN